MTIFIRLKSSFKPPSLAAFSPVHLPIAGKVFIFNLIAGGM
jgi:hypothetical protein